MRRLIGHSVFCSSYMTCWKLFCWERLVWVGRAATLVLLVGSFFYGLMMEEITRWLIFALWLMSAGIWLPNILQVRMLGVVESGHGRVNERANAVSLMT